MTNNHIGYATNEPVNTKGLMDWIAMINPEAVHFGGMENAIVGMGSRPGMPRVIVYDYDLLCEIVMRDGADSFESAREHVEFNMVGAWHGENTPIIVTRRLD
jgi:hypothetical protein|tara:strand:+ start:323 stop:628 length:306 start_codon:yes stop_codon:yes gene_type:complete